MAKAARTDMNEQNQADTAAADEAKKNEVYNLAGTVSGLEVRKDKNGNPYSYMRFATTVGGKATTRVAMAFGKAHQNISTLKDGAARLLVKFDGGVFIALTIGNEPKAKAA